MNTTERDRVAGGAEFLRRHATGLLVLGAGVTAGLLALAFLILASHFDWLCSCLIVHADGRQEWCADVRYLPPDGETVQCNGRVYRTRDLRAVVNQR